MALNPRQQRLYVHTVDLYRPVAQTIDPFKGGADVAYTLAYTSVPCYFYPTPEVDVPDPVGRNKEFNIFTLDRFHFDAVQEVYDTWVAKLTTPGHPNIGEYWRIEGNAQTRVSYGRRRPGYLMVYAKHIEEPPKGVS